MRTKFNEKVLRVEEKRKLYKCLVLRRDRIVGQNLYHPDLLNRLMEGMFDGKNWVRRNRFEYTDSTPSDS